ncbi:MAG TPA: sugar kinase [Nocardioidaceae bacterium]|nr:sugar kinase [Nocardioidaceae bacterium]
MTERDCVTFGETMALLYAQPTVPLAHATAFTRSIAGAESNLAIGLARLGHRVGWFGRVGADAFGTAVLGALRAASVDVSRARVDDAAPTGLLVRDSHPQRRISVLYYRDGSAGSRLGPEDVDEEYVASARMLHVTGITPALSETALAATEKAVAIAKQHNVIVAFDPNLRTRLWSPADAAPVLQRLAADADIVLVGHHEGELLCGRPEAPAIAGWFGTGGQTVVVKQGAAGAWATDGEREWSADAHRVSVVDPVGAGDAFDAGYLSAVLHGHDVATALQHGCAAGALAVQGPGDTDALPTREDLAAALDGTDIDR